MVMTSRPPLRILRLGLTPYEEALALQESAVKDRREGVIPDTLFLLEHPPVLTMGRGFHPEHLLRSEEELRAMGVGLHEAGRGGDVTYHGPGQLVGYPILDLKPRPDSSTDRRDLHRYLRDLEGVLIETLAELGVESWATPGLTGVWTEQGKVAAIGVRVSSGWITSHGFALNIAPNLEHFGTIVPCGIHDQPVASLETLLPQLPAREVVESILVQRFRERFELD